MMRSLYSLVVALCCFLAGAASAGAEVLEIQNVKVDMPLGWVSMQSASQRSIRLKAPGGKIEVTVVVHHHGASSDGDIEQLAKRLSDAESQAFVRMAKESGLSVSHQKASVDKEGNRWQLLSVRGLSNGTELRGVTTFEAGRAISIGAESRSAGQPELESAVRLISGRIGA